MRRTWPGRPGELTERHAARWWRLGGRFMRPSGEAAFGLGVELDEPGRVRAWVRAERFPSVFLSPGLPPAVGVVYAAFHAHVSLAYLGLLRAQLAR